MPEKERLQKILAAAGLGSRRACEEIILQGRVTVNGQVAQLGQSADPVRDRIAVDGKLVRPKKQHTYIALYKPVGVVSTARDEEARQAVVDLVQPALEKERGEKVRLYPVGRLDLLSEGLVLLTDDGELAQLLMHPRYEHTKEYNVAVSGSPSEATLQRWRDGVELEDGMTAPAEVTVLRREGGRTWLDIVMHEGRNREIRRVAELLGHPATLLIRVRIGPVELGTLRPGEWRYLAGAELKELRQLKRQAGAGPKGEQGPGARGTKKRAPGARGEQKPAAEDRGRPRTASMPGPERSRGQRQPRGERGGRRREDKPGRR